MLNPCRKSGYFIVDLYHNKKYHNNTTFENSFKEHMGDDNIQSPTRAPSWSLNIVGKMQWASLITW